MKALHERDSSPPPVQLEKIDRSPWNHFGVDYWMGFNVQAKFTSGGFATPTPPGPSAGSAVNRTYSDGFVHVDSSGNAGGQTWNWGYQNASQISGGNVLMHAASLTSATSQSDNANPIPGFKFSYIRDFSHGDGERWGIKFAFGYMDMNFSSSGALNGGEQLITDAYPLHGVVPPLAPYSGSLNGPGAVLGSTPSRTTSTGVATIAGTRSVDATLYEFQVGPTFALDLTKRLTAEFGAGVAFGVMDSTFTYDETVTATGLGTLHAAGRTSGTTSSEGGYAEAGLAYRLCNAASVFAGAELQDMGGFNQSTAGHSVQLDFSHSVFLLLGFEVHF